MVADPQWLDAHLGPLEIVALALALGPAPAPGAWQVLLQAVDDHRVRLIDLEFVRRTAGRVEVLTADDLPDVVPPEFAGAGSDLLRDGADLDAITADLQPDEMVAVLLVEHLGLHDVVHAFESAGARVTAGAVLDPADLEDALGAEE